MTPEPLNRPAVWETKCREGDAETCWVVAIGYEQGGSGAWGDFRRDPLRAAQFYRLGCDRGHVKSCAKVAGLLLHGIGVTADPGAAFLIARDACSRDDDEACWLAGRILRTGMIGGEEPARASYYFIRSCDLGSGRACAEIEEEGTHRSPRSEPPDGAAGFRLGSPVADAQRACEGAGHAWSTTTGVSARSRCSGTAAKLAVSARAELESCNGGSICGLRLLHTVPSNGARSVLREFASLEDRLRKRYGPASQRTRMLPVECSTTSRTLTQCVTQKRATLVARWEWDGGPVVSLELVENENAPTIVIGYFTARSERERKLEGL